MASNPSIIDSKLSTETRPPPSTLHPSPILKAAGIMGGLTVLSRVLGLVRDLLIAVTYGTGSVTQAFVVAFRIPNLLRDLAGEGAANSVFVPVFSRIRTQEGSASWAALAQAVWGRMLLSFALISLVGIAAAPWLVRGIAPGFRSDPAQIALTVQLTRILFPFIGLVGVAAFFMGLLNSVQHFAGPSLGPAVLNLCMIAGIFLWKPDAMGLAWGVIAGGILQMGIQWPVLRRAGVKLGARWTWHPGIREIRRLLIPRTIGSGVYQVSVLVDTIFASFGHLVGAGGVASLYFAHRFLHLPLALFGISTAQAALPTLSSQAAAEDTQAVRGTCLAALRLSLAVAIPSSIGLLFLGYPIIQSLLERGAFSSDSTGMTAAALQGYAVGLSFFCAVKVLVNTLYAFHDTWTPVRSSLMALGLNVILNFILIWPMKLGGLALATSLSSAWNCFHLYKAVCARVGSMTEDLKGWTLRVLAASLGMGVVSWAVWNLGLRIVGFSGSSWMGIGWLFCAIGAGAGSFLLLSFLLQIEEAQRVVRWAFRRS